MALIDPRAIADALADAKIEVEVKTATAMERVIAKSAGKTVAEMAYLLKQELQREGIELSPENLDMVAQRIADA